MTLAWHWYFNSTDGPGEPTLPPLADILSDAEKRFAHGEYRVAISLLTATERERARDVASLSHDQRRRWKQLTRETALYADLLAEPLEEIVKNAVHVSANATAAEWEADFEHRYQGRAVLFDFVIHRDIGGSLKFFDPLSLAQLQGAQARLNLDEVSLLMQLDLETNPRVLFGVRLASVRQEKQQWIVRFQPQSGVLLSAQKPAERWCSPWGEADARKILADQALWLAKDAP